MEAALSNYDSLSALVHRLETELKSEILSAAELRARLANEPLTLEELREMDEPVWVACKPIEAGTGTGVCASMGISSHRQVAFTM